MRACARTAIVLVLVLAAWAAGYNRGRYALEPGRGPTPAEEAAARIEARRVDHLWSIYNESCLEKWEHRGLDRWSTWAHDICASEADRKVYVEGLS